VIPAVMPTYARSELTFDRGEGPYLYATDGRRYLDFSSGVAVTSLGHAHPRLIAALTAQAQKLWHCSNLYQIAGQKRLAERLVKLSFADTVFFCNSGAEAMEGAIKVARKYHAESGHEERYRLIACTGSFHGRTLATLAAAGAEKYLKGSVRRCLASIMSPSATSTKCAPRSRKRLPASSSNPCKAKAG